MDWVENSVTTFVYDFLSMQSSPFCWGYQSVSYIYWCLPALLVLLGVYLPLRTSVDVFRVSFLIITLGWIIPLDSHLVRNSVRTCPSASREISDQTLFSIPLEGILVVQASMTSLLYLILSKPVLHPLLIPTPEHPPPARHTLLYRLGQFVLVTGAVLSGWLVWRGDEGSHVGLILVWKCPVLLFIWSIAGYHILALPTLSSLGPIIVTTAYFWVVDSFTLHRSTFINSGTKSHTLFWGNFELEKALFFLVTNLLVIFSHVAFDRGYFILTMTTVSSPSASSGLFSSAPFSVIASCAFTSSYMDNKTVIHQLDLLHDTSVILKRKSRSFWTASSIFEVPLRVDLINLYAFCRVGDDLIDEDARTVEEGRSILKHVRAFVDRWYSSDIPVGHEGTQFDDLLIPLKLSASQRRAFFALPRTKWPLASSDSSSDTESLSLSPHEDPLREPLLELLDGFETDLIFKEFAKDSDSSKGMEKVLVRNDEDLKLYAYRVAGTVAKMCCHIIFRYAPPSYIPPRPRSEILEAAVQMGITLQLVNIARDIEVDERAGRVYVPQEWWWPSHHGDGNKNGGITVPTLPAVEPAKHFQPTEVRAHRLRLLRMATDLFSQSRPAIDDMPSIFGARKGLTVAVESYMEIGRQLEKKIVNGNRTEPVDLGDTLSMPPHKTRLTRPSVPKWRRIWVAWSTLMMG